MAADKEQVWILQLWNLICSSAAHRRCLCRRWVHAARTGRGHLHCSGYSLYAPRLKASSLKSLFAYLGSRDYPVSSVKLCNLFWIRGARRITKITRGNEESRVYTETRFLCFTSALACSCCPHGAEQEEGASVCEYVIQLAPSWSETSPKCMKVFLCFVLLH